MSELAPIHGRAPEYHTDRHGPSSRSSGRSRKGALKDPNESSSHITKDGTPSPGDMDVSTPGAFFAFPAGTSAGSETMSGPAPGRPGHRRHGSSASMSSGFAGVAGIGGGGIGGGSVVGAQSTHSAGSRHSSAGSRGGRKTRSKTGSKVASLAGSTRSGSRSSSKSPPATPAEGVPDALLTGIAGKGGRVARVAGAGIRAGADVQGNVPKAPKGARRTGFAQFLPPKGGTGVLTDGTPPSSRTASVRSTKEEIRNAWGLKQETLESDDDSIRLDATDMKAFQSGGVPSLPRDLGVEAALGPPPKAQAKRAAAAAPAPADAGVKRYSWALKRPSTSEFDVPPRTPERGRGGIRTSLARCSKGSQDDIQCPSPAAINAILNSRIGATRRGDEVDEYARGVVRGSRRQSSGAALAGIRAAWGTSMGGSQDDIGISSPSIGGVYSTSIVDDYDFSASEAENVELNTTFRRPVGGGTLAGARAAWGTSMGGSQDDMACPRPMEADVARNSRTGATSYRASFQPDDDSGSELDDYSRSLVLGVASSRRRPTGNTLAGVRAAWGASVGDSQDDMACPSPATANAILNSRAGAVYSRGGDGGSSTSAGIRNGRRGTSNTRTVESVAVTSGTPKGVYTPARRPRSEHRAVGSGGDSVERGRAANSRGAGGGGGGGGDGRTTGSAGARSALVERGGNGGGSRDNPGGIRGETSRGPDKGEGGIRDSETAGTGAGGTGRAVAATARRKWNPGQSSVFDSSGSSSSEAEGKPRGLRGIQVLDPELPDA